MAAFQEIASEFQTRFPNQPGLHRMEIKDQDFHQLFAMLDARQKWQRQAQALYQNKKLPLSAFAQVIHEFLIDAWHHMIHHRDGIFLVCDGNQRALEHSLTLLSEAKGIVLDLTVLS